MAVEGTADRCCVISLKIKVIGLDGEPWSSCVGEWEERVEEENVRFWFPISVAIKERQISKLHLLTMNHGKNNFYNQCATLKSWE